MVVKSWSISTSTKRPYMIAPIQFNAWIRRCKKTCKCINKFLYTWMLLKLFMVNLSTITLTSLSLSQCLQQYHKTFKLQTLHLVTLAYAFWLLTSIITRVLNNMLTLGGKHWKFQNGKASLKALQEKNGEQYTIDLQFVLHFAFKLCNL